MKQKIVSRILLFIILLILIVVSLFIGVTPISLADLFSNNELAVQVFWQVRVVRVVALLLAACGMCVSGLIMQQLAQNKFAAPSTATTIDGAKLGVMLSIIFFPSNRISETIMAFAFAMVATGIFLYFINRIKIKNAIFVPLLGLMIGSIIDSITTFISYQTDQVQNINSWLQADLTTLLKGNYEIIYLIVPALIIAYIYANKFTIAGMGKSFATNLGVHHQRILNIGLILVSLITASVVITIGSIPFLGLIIPNIVSIYYGERIKSTLIETSLLGAIFLFICDIFGRLIIFPYEMPLTLTVGVIGCIIFLILLLRNTKQNRKSKGGARYQKAN